MWGSEGGIEWCLYIILATDAGRDQVNAFSILLTILQGTLTLLYIVYVILGAGLEHPDTSP